MKKAVQIIVFFLCSAMPVFAQSDSAFTRIRVIKGDIVEFTVDDLDNVYTLSSRNQVKKYNVNGDSVAVFNDVRKFGKATLVDVSNPLKIVLYYRDFATVVMLDRFLNIVNTIDLRKQYIFQAKAIGQSYDNKIWVYDEMESKLKKIDEDGKLMQETPDLRLLMNPVPSPVKIYDENKYVYLYDSSRGINVFDYYGTLKNNILITHWQNFKVTAKYIFGSKGDTLYRYEIKSYLYDEWKLPVQLTNSKSFNFSSSRLYALKDSTVEIYSIR